MDRPRVAARPLRQALRDKPRIRHAWTPPRESGKSPNAGEAWAGLLAEHALAVSRDISPIRLNRPTPNLGRSLKMRLALFQPDIPQNLGAALRLGACLGVSVDIIEPCGFPLSDKAVRRAAMDYADRAEAVRHPSWTHFVQARQNSPGRLILFTTRGATPYAGFEFGSDDVLLFGRESAGAPDEVYAAADARLYIPLVPGARSLNVVTAAAMALGEALRQTGGFAPERI